MYKPINSLVRINVAKTIFLEYFSVKFVATLSDASRLPHTNASCPRVSLDPYVRMENRAWWVGLFLIS